MGREFFGNYSTVNTDMSGDGKLWGNISANLVDLLALPPDTLSEKHVIFAPNVWLSEQFPHFPNIDMQAGYLRHMFGKKYPLNTEEKTFQYVTDGQTLCFRLINLSENKKLLEFNYSFQLKWSDHFQYMILQMDSYIKQTFGWDNYTIYFPTIGTNNGLKFNQSAALLFFAFKDMKLPTGVSLQIVSPPTKNVSDSSAMVIFHIRKMYESYNNLENKLARDVCCCCMDNQVNVILSCGHVTCSMCYRSFSQSQGEKCYQCQQKSKIACKILELTPTDDHIKNEKSFWCDNKHLSNGECCSSNKHPIYWVGA